MQFGQYKILAANILLCLNVSFLIIYQLSLDWNIYLDKVVRNMMTISIAVIVKGY